jgi:prepilin-type N-terminal cleavage/methylation domain-containing protein
VTSALLHRLRDERGFTLTEMLASMAVLGILFAVFATVMTTTITQGTQEQDATALQTEARAAIERFAQELRQAYSGDTAWPIQSLTCATQCIQFLSPDRLQPFHLRQIQWRLSSGQLQRRAVTSTDTDGAPWSLPAIAAAAWTTEVRSIKNTTIFQFLDASDVATGTPANVRKVTITLDVATAGKSSRVYTYRTSITPRVSAS